MLVTLERDPTPDFAPVRTHFPTPGRRSEAPACSSPDLRVRAAYYSTLADLEACARAGDEGLPWGDEQLEGLHDFAPSLEEGITYANGGWSHDLEADPEPVGVL